MHVIAASRPTGTVTFVIGPTNLGRVAENDKEHAKVSQNAFARATWQMRLVV